MNWYDASTAENVLTVHLNGGFSRRQPVEPLVEAIGKAKSVNLVFGQSIGGYSSFSHAILNALEGKAVTTLVDRMAGSASALIAVLAPGKRVIRRGADLMLHGHHDSVFGPRAALLEAADRLAKRDEQIVPKLMSRTGNPESVVRPWLQSDHWFTAEQAVANGLADEILEAEIAEPVSFSSAPGSSVRNETEDERLFVNLLRQYRFLRVGNKERFAREVAAWLCREVSE